MRILMIRHGDPDYEHDSLTEVGKKRQRFLLKFQKICIWGTALYHRLAGRRKRRLTA